MSYQYILVDKEPKPIEDFIEWANFMENNRIVEQTEIDDIKISTVFLGFDHQFGEGKPILFETMIFGGEKDEFQDRYCSWDEAVQGHKNAVELVKKSL